MKIYAMVEPTIAQFIIQAAGRDNVRVLKPEEIPEGRFDINKPMLDFMCGMTALGRAWSEVWSEQYRIEHKGMYDNRSQPNPDRPHVPLYIILEIEESALMPHNKTNFG